jgi:iron complex outermembrane receptor protein
MGLHLSEQLLNFFNTDIDANNNTPALCGNLVVGWQASKRLRLHGHLMYESHQTSYNTDLVKLILSYNYVQMATDYYNAGDIEKAQIYGKMALEAIDQIIMRKDMSARAIVNMGGEYKIGAFTLGLDIHNLFGTHYYRSGMNTNLIPQQGRWFIGSIGIRL